MTTTKEISAGSMRLLVTVKHDHELHLQLIYLIDHLLGK